MESMQASRYSCVTKQVIDPSFEAEWQALWERSAAGNFFNSPKFFRACIETFRTHEYRVFCCYAGKQLVGVLPLVRDKIFGVRAWATPLRRQNYLDYVTLLMSEHSDEVLQTLIQTALGEGNVYLAEMDAQAHRSFFVAHPRYSFLQSTTCVRTRTIDAASDILHYMPADQCREIRRRIRKMGEYMHFAIEGIEAIEKVKKVERESYRPRYFMELFSNGQAERFLRTLEHQDPDCVQIGVLSYQGEPIATLTCFMSRGTLYTYHVAFDEKFSCFGPGKAVFYLMLDILKHEGITKVDFLRGDSYLKRQFADTTHGQFDVYLSRRFPILWYWRGSVCIFSWLKRTSAWLRTVPDVWRKFQSYFLRHWQQSIRLVRRSLTQRNQPKRQKRNRIIISSFDDIGNPYYGGGGAIAVHEVAKRLSAKHGYDVVVITGAYPQCARRETIDGVRYRRIGPAHIGPRTGQLLFHFLLIWQVIRRSYDVWIESFTPPFSTSCLPLFTAKPVVGLVHFLSGEEMYKRYRIPFHWVERLGLKCYRHIIVLSEDAKRKIGRYATRAQLHVIPNGIDPPKKREATLPKHILYIGRIDVNQKGLDLLIEAYKRIADKTQYPLVIAGNGGKAEEAQLRELVRQSGLSERIKLVGRVEGREKERAFNEAAIVVVPSRYETFGLVALEALAYGVPVVTFDIEGFRWLPDELTNKAKPFLAEDLGEKKMLALASGSVVMNEALRAFADRYRWENVTQTYQAVIETAITDSLTPTHKAAQQPLTESMDTILQDILKNRKPCFFISPHLDDAILSAGGLLTYLADKTQVTVATVFTEAETGSNTLSAKQFLHQCQYADAQQLFEDRRREDRQALEQIGITAVHMGFSDALWRKRPALSFWRRKLARYLPEAAMVYPTYRFHIAKGSIHPVDQALMQQIKEKLKALVQDSPAYYVFAPQAIGHHADHVIVHQVCRAVFPQVIEWSDFPYNLREGVINENAWCWKENQDAKKGLILAYKTQVKPMFGANEAVPIIPELYRVSHNSLL